MPDIYRASLLAAVIYVELHHENNPENGTGPVSALAKVYAGHWKNQTLQNTKHLSDQTKCKTAATNIAVMRKTVPSTAAGTGDRCVHDVPWLGEKNDKIARMGGS